jgi:hypothetical protein
MKRIILAAILAAGTVQADEDAIQGVIDAQIEAFLKGDMATAFGFAAPTIQGMFQTPDRFGEMVRRGYPMVWRPDSVEYLGNQVEGRVWAQDVLVSDAEGRLHLLEYSMVETPAGWKIAGVRLKPVEDFGV